MPRLFFRESHHVANAFFAADQHDEPIEPESDAAVRRRAEPKRAQQMAEHALAALRR